jgi:D-alanyl-D-alanine carboxypeptidase
LNHLNHPDFSNNRSKPSARQSLRADAGLADIPEARREEDSAPSVAVGGRSPIQMRYWLLGAVSCVLVLVLGAIANFSSAWQPSDPLTPARPGLDAAVTWSTEAASTLGDGAGGQLLNHYPYDEAPAEALTNIVADGSIRLRRAAAGKYLDMVGAARREGVSLTTLSGFRSLDDQTALFFDVKAERGQRPVERAAVSAPPGYSEHHTGYAVDIGDANQPSTHLDSAFESTPAFRWLEDNAARFGYELSFPQNNAQNVSYEPWHWRFMGDRHSLETFYSARDSMQF